MQRLVCTPRPDWRRKVEALGLIWHSPDDETYWNEAAYYKFSTRQVDQIEAATAELYRLCLEAGEHIIRRNLFARFGIAEPVAALIRRAWEDEPPALNHGRFDLGYDGSGAPKLFEFNCDTPTSLLEAAVVQWDWKDDVFPRADQFNRLHDKLVAKWKDIAPYLRAGPVHFTHAADAIGEDALTVAYLRDTARSGGVPSLSIAAPDIGWDMGRRRFVDLAGEPIEVLFHLYPWEWLLAEDFGPHIAECYNQMQWIEPIWKMMWGNKALLPILWDLFPGHPNLLPASFDPMGSSYVRKPMLGREGANVTLVSGGREIATTGGDYDEGVFVYQALYDLPQFDGMRPVIGSWVVDGEPAGMGVREGGLITGNTARFTPHIFG